MEKVAYNTYTETLNTMYTTTYAARSKKIYDQVFKSNPFWLLISEGGRKDTQRGGTFIEEPIEYDENTTAQWLGRGGSVTLTETDPLTLSKWNWRRLAAHIIRYFSDEQQNAGENMLIKIVTAKINNLRKSMAGTLSTALFSDGTTANSIDGLRNIVAEAPATGTIAQINRANYSWWRNNYYDFDGASDTISVHLLKRMTTQWNNCGVYGQETDRFPTISITTQTLYEAFEEEARELGMIVMNDKANMVDLGFGDIKFKGRPITWDPNCPAQSIFILNTNYLRWVADPIANMSLGKWLDLPRQPGDVVAHALLVGNLVCSRPRAQSVLFDVVDS